MPNHNITTIVKICCDDPIKTNEIIDAITTDGCMDFEKIIPMPKALHGNVNHSAVDAAKKGEPCPFERDQAAYDKCKKNLHEYGHAYWYDWATANWGTKWNAYDGSGDGQTLTFDTAWNCPRAALNVIFDMFPDVRFEVTYADEDLGRNCGYFSSVSREGRQVGDGSYVARIFSLNVRGIGIDQYKSEYVDDDDKEFIKFWEARLEE